MSSVRSVMSRLLLAAAVIGIGAAALPAPAQAWWRGGWGGWGWHGGLVLGIAPPLYVAPPVVYAPPPPVYYAPPAYYAPQAPTYQPSASSGQGCYAGQYVCPLDHATPVGSNCSCPANTGRVYGQVR